VRLRPRCRQSQCRRPGDRRRRSCIVCAAADGPSIRVPSAARTVTTMSVACRSPSFVTSSVIDVASPARTDWFSATATVTFPSGPCTICGSDAGGSGGGGPACRSPRAIVQPPRFRLPYRSNDFARCPSVLRSAQSCSCRFVVSHCCGVTAWRPNVVVAATAPVDSSPTSKRELTAIAARHRFRLDDLSRPFMSSRDRRTAINYLARSTAEQVITGPAL